MTRNETRMALRKYWDGCAEETEDGFLLDGAAIWIVDDVAYYTECGCSELCDCIRQHMEPLEESEMVADAFGHVW